MSVGMSYSRKFKYLWAVQRVALRDFTVPQEEIASWPQRPRKAQQGSVCPVSYRTEGLGDANTATLTLKGSRYLRLFLFPNNDTKCRPRPTTRLKGQAYSGICVVQLACCKPHSERCEDHCARL